MRLTAEYCCSPDRCEKAEGTVYKRGVRNICIYVHNISYPVHTSHERWILHHLPGIFAAKLVGLRKIKKDA